MKIPADGTLLRIFIGESDRHDGKPLHEVIVHLARSQNMAGCTVIKGFEGFGANSRIHTSKILRISDDLPLIIEIVDAKDKIDQFLPQLDGIVKEGLVTLEKAQVVIYRHNQDK